MALVHGGIDGRCKKTGAEAVCAGRSENDFVESVLAFHLAAPLSHAPLAPDYIQFITWKSHLHAAVTVTVCCAGMNDLIHLLICLLRLQNCGLHNVTN